MIHYNIHPFGLDEFAVGHLINGDLPKDDEERWRIVDAPRYRIQKLFDEHLRAQVALSKCRDSGKPFILFLRSFSTEHKATREQGFIAEQFSTDSVNFQFWLKSELKNEDVVMIKLHGGSDAFIADRAEEAKVLSTKSDNWKPIAAELIEAASVIVFLVSHATAGVVDEFGLIRQSAKMARSVVVLIDVRATPNREGEDLTHLRARLNDFPNLFELKGQGDSIVYPREVVDVTRRLLAGAKTKSNLKQSLAAPFSYLEPSFATSADFVETETYIWRQLRLLRVLFDDTYWAALKSHDVPYRHFSFGGPWKTAHQAYGLGLATADFQAIRESLSYLSLLYAFRGADFALLLDPLAAQYRELGEQIFPDGEPDTEAQFADGPDPLELPAKITVALDLFEIAQAAGQRQDAETAVYLYQAAVVCALRAKDGDDARRRWIVANMCRDWAKYQGQSEQLGWAITNCTLAVKLFRNLGGEDPGNYRSDLALCLNNLGALQFRHGDLTGAEQAWVEALDIRRAEPPESEGYLVNLYTSLANLGMLRVKIDQLDSARALYNEALTACEKDLIANASAIVTLTRLQGWMSLCLAGISEAAGESRRYAEQAANNLAIASGISPQSEAELRELVNEALRASAEPQSGQ